MSSSDLDLYLSSFLHDPASRPKVTIPKFNHRIRLNALWSIPKGSSLLDIGCGQGESSLILALAAGPDGHVTGIDTCLPDYGGPFTVSQSQSHALASPLGPRLSFSYSDAETHLFPPSSPSPPPLGRGKYSAAILCHSLWYFPSSDAITSLFGTLAEAGIPKVYLAEYAFEASLPEQVPHVLAAEAQALLHASRVPRPAGTRDPNVRAAQKVGWLLDAVRAAGYGVERQGKFVPAEELWDGCWESQLLQMDLWKMYVKKEMLGEEREAELLGYGTRVREEVERLRAKGVERVRTMDVWWAVVELGGEGSQGGS